MVTTYMLITESLQNNLEIVQNHSEHKEYTKSQAVHTQNSMIKHDKITNLYCGSEHI